MNYVRELVGQGWIIEVFTIVLITLILSFVINQVLSRLIRKTERSESPWDDALLSALRRPLRLLIWVVGITFAAEVASQQSDAAIFKAITPIRDVGVIATIAWFMIRFVKRFEEALIEGKEQAHESIDRSTVHAMGKLVRTAVIITSLLVVLQTLGFSISGVLAFGGIGGIAIGFAAKDLLSNFFGGLMIYLDRPFTVGDWIRSPDREIEGTVEDIGWRLTKIRKFDKRPLYVPNSIFANIAVENPSRMSHRRIYETIGIRYVDLERMPEIVTKVTDMLRSHEEIDATQTLIVNFDAFNDSSVDFFVYTFTKTTNWVHFHKVKQDILIEISNIISSFDAEIAFPTRVVQLETTDDTSMSLNVSSS